MDGITEAARSLPFADPMSIRAAANRRRARNHIVTVVAVAAIGLAVTPMALRAIDHPSPSTAGPMSEATPDQTPSPSPNAAKPWQSPILANYVATTGFGVR